MHGYGMVGDLLHLALYLASIGFWSLLWMVCIFNAKGRLKRFLGAHALLICILLFPLLPATFIGGAVIAFGIEAIAWICGVLGIGLPLAGLRLIMRYPRAGPSGHS